ncbi:SRPBCC domain-containing protein [Demequina muriae]|uniref:SRPBCC domain-containing protein n=1 Tax=Demequina muriae TaxID=3051664 RepID=A0ABT8GIL5_9MICO|nr:SRPBCC domain-containing protein [Demequina sp. EGI L300058]MDN4481252.1 SRPBCC domain-containing protein [Demequina sp. EGI L300058]
MSPTQNPPAEIDNDVFSVSRTITIAAPPEKVWAAVTEPEHIERWHTSAATLTALEPGGTGEWTFEGYGTAPIRIESVEPMRSVTYRWGSDGDTELVDGRSTVFTFTLEAIEGGTRLHVHETGFEMLKDPQGALHSNQEGWTVQLDKLVAYLEGDA